MNEKLKPCPFCGNPAKLRYECDKREIIDLWCVQCENELCYAMTGWETKKEWAIKRWNRRIKEMWTDE